MYPTSCPQRVENSQAILSYEISLNTLRIYWYWLPGQCCRPTLPVLSENINTVWKEPSPINIVSFALCFLSEIREKIPIWHRKLWCCKWQVETLKQLEGRDCYPCRILLERYTHGTQRENLFWCFFLSFSWSFFCVLSPFSIKGSVWEPHSSDLRKEWKYV